MKVLGLKVLHEWYFIVYDLFMFLIIFFLFYVYIIYVSRGGIPTLDGVHIVRALVAWQVR